MMLEGKQTPVYYVAESSRIENIKIAISQHQFNTKVTQTIKAADELCAIKYPNSNLVDIQCLANAAKKVGEIINLDPRNKEIPRLRNNIDDAVKAYLQPTINWLTRNMRFARRKINQIDPTLYDRKLPKLIQSLSFDELQKIGQIKLDSLIHLCGEVADNTEFISEDDPQLMIFQSKLCASFLNTIGAARP
jgi:hypothetical protein